jgi:hypothetical protein
MDTETMEFMVTSIYSMSEYETYTEEQIVGEIVDLYGEDMVHRVSACCELELVTAGAFKVSL